MVLIKLLLSLILIIFITSCNSGKTDEEMEELWSKAQTTGEIIKGQELNLILVKTNG